MIYLKDRINKVKYSYKQNKTVELYQEYHIFLIKVEAELRFY